MKANVKTEIMSKNQGDIKTMGHYCKITLSGMCLVRMMNSQQNQFLLVSFLYNFFPPEFTGSIRK